MALSKEELAQQAKQTSRVYFIGLKRKSGVVLSEFEEDLVLRKSLKGLSMHVKRHKLKQNTIDSYKLVGFLAYYTCSILWDREGEDENEIPTASVYSVERLSTILKLETSSRVDLPLTEKRYISSMLEAEVCNAEHAGIGANGIGAVFAFMAKAFDKVDSWKIETASI